jgi:hypothetical protein
MEGKEDSSSKTCLFKRVKRGGISSGRRSQKQPSSGSSSEDSSDNEIYKRAKKSRSGLVQSTSAFKKDSSKKRKWQKQVS